MPAQASKTAPEENVGVQFHTVIRVPTRSSSVSTVIVLVHVYKGGLAHGTWYMVINNGNTSTDPIFLALDDVLANIDVDVDVNDVNVVVVATTINTNIPPTTPTSSSTTTSQTLCCWRRYYYYYYYYYYGRDYDHTRRFHDL